MSLITLPKLMLILPKEIMKKQQCRLFSLHMCMTIFLLNLPSSAQVQVWLSLWLPQPNWWQSDGGQCKRWARISSTQKSTERNIEENIFGKKYWRKYFPKEILKEIFSKSNIEENIFREKYWEENIFRRDDQVKIAQQCSWKNLEVERRGQVLFKPFKEHYLKKKYDLFWAHRQDLVILNVHRDGMLDSDEFALAMHLMNIKLDGE